MRLALFLPLGVTSCRHQGTSGFTDVSPVFTSPLRVKATQLIEPASASPTFQDLHA
jgi:hypothetical protein